MPGQDVALELASDEAHRSLYEILADAHADEQSDAYPHPLTEREIDEEAA